MSRIPWIVHTFNKYEKYWDGCIDGFRKHFHNEFDLILLTDTPDHGSHDFAPFRVVYSGEGEWSDRLIKGVSGLDCEFLAYSQEDMWPRSAPPVFEKLMRIMVEKDLWRLQISPIVQFYSLIGSEIPLFFHYKSKYLVSHQPSIWKKSALLRCLKPNEDPWKNEYEGTKRLNHEGLIGKIAIYPHNWFTHESVKGVNLRT